MLRLLKNKQFWGGLIAVLLLAYCVKDIRLTDLEDLLRHTRYDYLALSVGVSFVFIIFRGLRWRFLVIQQSAVPVVRGVTLFSAGQVLNIVLPALTGQVGRLILFAKRLGLRKSFVFSTIVLEVVFDAISLIVFMLFTSLAFAFPAEYRSVSIILVIVTVVLLVLLYLMLHYQHPFEEFWRRRLSRRWPGVYVTIKKFLRSFTQGLELLRSYGHMARSIGLSLASWTAHLVAIYLLFHAFSFSLPVGAAAVLMIVNTLVLMIPLTPGNAGTFEVVVSTSLMAFGIPKSDAVLFALALHAVDILPIVAMGLFYLRYEGVTIRELKETPTDETILDRISEEGQFVEEERR